MSRVSDLLEYSPDELVGRSLYSLVYGQDIIQIRKCHSDCEFSHSQSMVIS